MTDSPYFDELCRAMYMLAARPRAVFIGQAVGSPGTAMFNTLREVPVSQRLELPVAEDMQMGMAIGMALAGDLPICIYPRINFLLLAMSQLVLHLDKLPAMGAGRPRVIIRTAVATNAPLDPGPQHLGDFTNALADMLGNNVLVERIYSDEPNDIASIYAAAAERDGSTLVIESLEAY